MHCEGCRRKVFNCLRGFDGIEDIVVDNANQKVIVKGKSIDPMKIVGRLQKKYSRNVELISPKPKPNDEYKEEEVQEKQQPKVKTIVLKMNMHCEGCAHDIKRNIGRMEGIMFVEPDMENSLVVIRGLFDPPKLIEKITKRLGKHVEIVEEESFEEKKKEKKYKEEIMVYPPHYNFHYVDPSLFFSDENVFSCSIM
ncbi:hypothetical protein MANES_13G008700v8 [Manihot esculenta]|uniref:Uncharacterized protein n=3 Tax=Manihot esculenta TaxID=3983 RepID=A0ACB7GJP2_MANES|nr:hypothetical protein MANES_13G008700v8 [Manihot esculenta]